MKFYYQFENIIIGYVLAPYEPIRKLASSSKPEKQKQDAAWPDNSPRSFPNELANF